MKSKVTPPPPLIAVDTREQLPYEFPLEWPVIRKALPSGDYSLIGYESEFAIERKSQTDLLGCWHTDRFKRELERLSKFKLAYLVLESTIYKLERDRFYKGNPKSVIGFLQSIPLRFGVHVMFLDNRETAQEWVRGTLGKLNLYKLNEITR
jgi:ERCC4-type nuclease